MLLHAFVRAEEKELTLAEAKALYTIEITKQVIWPNEALLTEFLIGIVGKDVELSKAFMTKQAIKVRGKQFRFETIEGLNFSAERYSIIFITKRKRSLNSEIYNHVKDTLIISDGRVEKDEQMVALITSRDQLKIKLNLSNLSKKHFDISTNLLEFAGTKEDLTEQLREKENNLRLLLSQVQEKEKNLTLLNDSFIQNNQILKSTKQELSKYKEILNNNKKQLIILTNNIKKSNFEVNENKNSIDEQRKLIAQKQLEISSQESSRNELLKQISKNKKILDTQLSKLENQTYTIKNKNKTISEQREWMMMILIVSAIFFGLIYFLLKSNASRKKINQELEDLNSQLYEFAITDGMTKLFNRRHFLELTQKELVRQQRQKHPPVMLMIDIDFFKNINDTYGHVVGDQVIISVANSLKECMREYDILGRLGGEEYALMLVECDIDLAAEIAQRVCDKISKKKVNYNDLSINTSVSIGLSQVNSDDTDVEQSLVRADKALYSAKENGRNRIVVYTDKLA